MPVRKAGGRRSHPYGTLIRAFYWAVALGQNSWGRVCRVKGSLRGVGGSGGKESAESVRIGKGFIARLGLPYKEEKAGSAVIGGQGLRVSS